MKMNQPNSLKNVKKLAKKIMRLDAPGRNLSVYSDDLYIVSYPKSGNTWVRFLMAHLLFPESVIDFVNIEKLIPDPYKATRRVLANTPRPRTLKSHEFYDERYSNLIYIARDPRSVCVSYFHHMKKMGRLNIDTPFDTFVRSFIKGDIDTYGSWDSHVTRWRDNVQGSSLFIRYEDLILPGIETLSKIAIFLQLDRSEKELMDVKFAASFGEMSQLESKQSESWQATKNSRSDIKFVRGGKTDEWKSYLGKGIELIETNWQEAMIREGYL